MLATAREPGRCGHQCRGTSNGHEIVRSTAELIGHKRDGGTLGADEIHAFLAGVVDGSIPDYQISAMLMAIYFQGMGDTELADFTEAMIASGDRLDIPTTVPKVDKHSTGGVGDKVSIPLTPLVAACGVAVPMMSGRGLGHTGGTLDKLEAITGYRTSLSPDEFAALVGRHGAVIAGQSALIVPADKVLYALRDTTATVGSIPLISSSIMSKKLAEGLDALVLDVKVGDGAFMADSTRAAELARTMIRIGASHGVTVRAFLTNMDQPLGRQVGNANEIAESISVLHGEGPDDVTELVHTLGAAMLQAADIDGGREKIAEAVASGAGAEKFAVMVEAQGGDRGVVENPDRLPKATHSHPIRAVEAGFVTRLGARAIGTCAVYLGAGRQTADDRLDPAAGITLQAKIGDRVEQGETLAVLHYNDDRFLEEAAGRAASAYTIGSSAPEPAPLILEEIT